MKLRQGLHLAYCTNIHRGEDWPETFRALQQHTLSVRNQVSPAQPYAIGLRLSDLASRQLAQPDTLDDFRRWLDRENCYIFTLNGFPYGRFHGTRVKEQVYRPDWSTQERLEYTLRLFDILAQLLPPGCEGSVSTVPGSFKSFIHDSSQTAAIRARLWECIDYLARLSDRTGRDFHLGLEPEPLCLLETSSETVAWFEAMRADRPRDRRIDRHLGVNYDTCHLAVEFEEPTDVIQRFRAHGVRISKLHLSSALKVFATAEVRAALRSFADDTYLHQVVERTGAGTLRRYADLDVALREAKSTEPPAEWRIHFHIPLHSQPSSFFDNTSEHLLGVLDLLAQDPGLCSHLEMETYTWEVMPAPMKNRDVAAQLVSEYEWTLRELAGRGLGLA